VPPFQYLLAIARRAERGRRGSDHFGIVTQSWSPAHARWVDELGTGWVRLDFNAPEAGNHRAAAASRRFT
jgi:hypothetical protein